MRGRRPNLTSSRSELEDNANPQLAHLLEAVCELQEKTLNNKNQMMNINVNKLILSSEGRAETTTGESRV